MNASPRPSRRAASSPLAACLLACLAAPGLALAGGGFPIHVDTASGAAEIASQCTLKSALRAALHNLPSGSCAVPPVGVAGEIHLPANAEIVIDDSVGFGFNGEFAPGTPFVAAQANGPGLSIRGHGATVRRAGPACDPTAPNPQTDVAFLVLFQQRGAVALESLRLQNFCNASAGLNVGGGALYADAPQITLERVQLIGNRALATGGGAELIAPLIRVVDTQVQGNRVFTAGLPREGSGLNLIEDLPVAGHGRGIQVDRSSFIDNAIAGSSSLSGLGAALRVAVRSRLELDNSTFVDNVGTTVGALSLSRSSSDDTVEAVLRHNTFLRNSSASFSTLRTPIPTRLLNNLLLAGAGTACGFEGGVTLSGINMSNSPSCSGWVQVPGEGVVAASPSFSGGQVPTLRLLPGSPAIDAATACPVPGEEPTLDARGNQRPRDGDGNGSAECDVGATEYLRNTAPELAAPQAVATSAGVPYVFSVDAGSRLGISDPDAQSLPLQVELAVNRGSIRFASEAGLSCSGGNGPAGGPLRRCIGSQAQLNQALEGAVFVPPAGYTGPVLLELRADDFGNGGDDGRPLSNLRTVDIEVLPLSPLLALESGSLDFGAVVVGATASASVGLSNPGNAPLLLQAPSLSGAPHFALSSDCPIAPASLAPQASCSLQIEFAPQAAGALAGSVLLQSNAPSSPDLLLLDGEGQGAGLFGNGFE